MTNNVIHPQTKVGQFFEIGLGNIIGPKRKRLNVKYPKNNYEEKRYPSPVIIGNRVVIMNHTVIYEGVKLSDDIFIDDYVKIGANSIVGEGSIIMYGAFIMENVKIGNNCRIAGFIPNDVVIGNDVTMMGNIAHKYNRPLDWNKTEPSPRIENNVVVGMGALIVGEILIEQGSYIAGNATVTKNVPPNSIVFNTNEIKTSKGYNLAKK